MRAPSVVRLIGIAVAAIAVAVVAIAWLDPGLWERVQGDTVEARIDDYVAAVMRGDRAAALDAWQLDPRRPNAEALTARRDEVTARLLDLRIPRYGVERIDWWQTCCEPGPIDGPRNAGLGRAVVRFDAGTSRHYYVFDVLARDTTYWGDAAGSPPHEWTFRDVYLVGERPLFAAFADPVAQHPLVIEAVRRYYDRFAEALATCDPRRLWAQYPEIAVTGPPGAGINIEGARAEAGCGTLRAVTFEIEARAPVRVHEHADGIDVIVHGMEHWDYGTHGVGGGEFETTLTLRSVDGQWTVVRTDEVTLGEFHERAAHR